VPQSQPSGTLKITTEFDSGPLAGVIRAERRVEVGP
jgi:hypothetical protein